MSDINPYATSSSIKGVPPTHCNLVTPFALVLGGPLLVNFGVLIATGNVEKFLWLFGQAAPWLIFAGPLTIPLLIWLEYAAKSAKSRDQLKAFPILWVVPLILIPIMLLTWGAVFAHSRGRGYVRWHLLPVHWAFYSTFLFAAVAVVLNPGRRGFVASLSSLLIVFSFFCSFTAGMSVTGDWL